MATVIPAKAGIQCLSRERRWVPACAKTTVVSGQSSLKFDTPPGLVSREARTRAPATLPRATRADRKEESILLEFKFLRRAPRVGAAIAARSGNE